MTFERFLLKVHQKLLFSSHSEVKQQQKSSEKEKKLFSELYTLKSARHSSVQLMLIQEDFPPCIYTFKQIIFA